RRWVAGPDSAPGRMPKKRSDGAPRVSVWDADSGRTLCTIPPLDQASSVEDYYSAPCFVHGSDLMAVHHFQAPKGKDHESLWLEVWRAPFGKAPERRIPGVKIAPWLTRSGRVAWKSVLHDPKAAAFDVFDLNTGEFLFSSPSREGRPTGAA